MSGRYTASNARRARELAHATLMGLGGGQFNSSEIINRRNNKNDGRAVGLNCSSSNVNGEHTCVRRLRDKLKARGSVSGIHEIGRIFRSMDNNDDKRLSKNELEWGLRDFGVTFNKAELNELFVILDRDGNGDVNFDELLRTLRGPMSAERLDLISQAFEKVDVTKDGVVTLDDLEKIYDASCHPKVQSGQMTSAEALRDFLKQWDTLEADGIVTKNEFIEYYKNVSACVDTDEYFEAMMIKAWDLDGSTAAGNEPAVFTVSATHLNGSVSEHDIDVKECGDRIGNVDLGRVQDALGRRDVTAVRVDVKGLDRNRANANADEVNENPYETSSLTSRTNINNATGETAWQPKPNVPRWVKYDRVVLGFRLYATEQCETHYGTFDPRTREYETKTETHFGVRTFVLSWFLVDDSSVVTEPNSTAGIRSATGATFARKGVIVNPKTGKAYEAIDLMVGNVVVVKGIKMRVYDLDEAARAYFASEHPTVSIPKAMAVPKGTVPTDKDKATHMSPQQPIRVKQAESLSNGSCRDGPSDVVLQFDCVWCVPEPEVGALGRATIGMHGNTNNTSSKGSISTGETRRFGLRYFVDDNSVQINEVNLRNSGRGRESLFHLRRQKLTNPNKRAPDEGLQPYLPVDLMVGNKIEVFGKQLQLIACSDTTRAYYISQNKSQPDTHMQDALMKQYKPQSMVTSSPNKKHSGTSNDTTDGDVRPYSHPGQKRTQLLVAIRARIEQSTNYSNADQNRAKLSQHMKREAPASAKGLYDRRSFRHAMLAFALGDAEADILFDSLLPDSHSHSHQRLNLRTSVDQYVDYKGFVYVVFPVATNTNIGFNHGFDAQYTCDPSTAVAKDVRLQRLVKAVKDKLECRTNFGDAYHHRQTMKRILDQEGQQETGKLSRMEFRAAMAGLNCGHTDADYLFRVFESDENQRVDIHSIVSLCTG